MKRLESVGADLKNLIIRNSKNHRDFPFPGIGKWEAILFNQILNKQQETE